MSKTLTLVSRRILLGSAAAFVLFAAPVARAERVFVKVTRDPGCGCCEQWAAQLTNAGFKVELGESDTLADLKTRLGVPDDLSGCHTAEVAGYVLEGHVPLDAIERLLATKPVATGLAVPGMPAGSPGMGGEPEEFEVVLFGPAGRLSFGKYRGSTPV